MKNGSARVLVCMLFTAVMVCGCSPQTNTLAVTSTAGITTTPISELAGLDATASQAAPILPADAPTIPAPLTVYEKLALNFEDVLDSLESGTYWIDQSQSDLYVHSLEGNLHLPIAGIFPDNSLAISPDRKFLALWKQNIQNELVLVDLASGSDTILPVNSECWGNQLQWSPDNASIAVKCWRNARMRIELYNVATLEREGVLNIPESFFSERMLQDISISSFAWSPDGEWMGYIATNPSFESLNSSVLVTSVSCIRTGEACDDQTQLIETSQIVSKITWISSDRILVTPLTSDGYLEIYSIQDHALISQVSFEHAPFITSILALPKNGGILISVEPTYSTMSGIYLFSPGTGEIREIEQSDSNLFILNAFLID